MPSQRATGLDSADRTGPGPAGRWTLLAAAGRAPLTCWALAAGLLMIAGTPLTGPRDLSEPKLDGGRLQVVLPALSWNMIRLS